MKLNNLLIVLMNDELDRAGQFAFEYARTHRKEIQSEYGEVILAVQDRVGIVGWGENLTTLAREVISKQAVSGGVAYGRLSDLLVNESLWRHIIKR